MPRKIKDNTRFSLNDFLDSDMQQTSGELFNSHDGTVFDSKKVKLIHSGLDTIKQLYQGLVNQHIFLAIKYIYDNKPDDLFDIHGYKWKVGSGRRGGYRYSLNSRELGVVILFGSHYLEPQYNGHHLKIELSPNFILLRTTEEIQTDMDDIASLFVTQKQATGCAIHICADVQGWTPPDDLDRKMTTKAKRVYKASGETAMSFETHSIATVYGRGETFTFGGVSALQFSVYDKSKAVRDKDELEFWQQKWNMAKNHLMDGIYNPELKVTRLEARFHHTVISQFAMGSSLDLRTFSEVSKHLTGLWKYALNNFRLDDSSTYVNPFWQYMRDDLVFYHDSQAIEYKRCFKSEIKAGAPSDRSIMICFGQLSSIYARSGFSITQAFDSLFQSGIYHHLVSIYNARKKDELDIKVDLQNKLYKFNEMVA